MCGRAAASSGSARGSGARRRSRGRQSGSRLRLSLWLLGCAIGIRCRRLCGATRSTGIIPRMLRRQVSHERPIRRQVEQEAGGRRIALEAAQQRLHIRQAPFLTTNESATGWCHVSQRANSIELTRMRCCYVSDLIVLERRQRQSLRACQCAHCYRCVKCQRRVAATLCPLCVSVLLHSMGLRALLLCCCCSQLLAVAAQAQVKKTNQTESQTCHSLSSFKQNKQEQQGALLTPLASGSKGKASHQILEDDPTMR